MKIIDNSHNCFFGSTMREFFKRFNIKKFESLNIPSLEHDFKLIDNQLTVTIENGDYDFPAVDLDEYLEDTDMTKDTLHESVDLLFDIDGKRFKCCICDSADDDEFNEIRLTDIDNFDDYVSFFIVNCNNIHKIHFNYIILLWLCEIKWLRFGFLHKDYNKDTYILYDIHTMNYRIFDNGLSSCLNYDVLDEFLKYINMEGFIIDC